MLCGRAWGAIDLVQWLLVEERVGDDVRFGVVATKIRFLIDKATKNY